MVTNNEHVNIENLTNVLDESLFTEYSYNLSDIQQIDGNDSVISDKVISNEKVNSKFRVIEANVNSLKQFGT